MAGRPPDLGAEIVPGLSHRFDRLREQDGLADRGGFRREALLLCLGPERGEIGRNDDARHDFRIGLFEGVDLGGEIVRQILIPAWIRQGVAQIGEHRRKAEHGIAPGIPVSVVGE